MYINRISKIIRSFLDSPEKIVLSLALVFGILSAVLVPQMTVSDEGAHFLKSYSLSTGKITGARCDFPKDILDKAGSLSQSSGIENLNKSLDYENIKNTTCGSAGNYSPIMHLPQAIGIGLGKLFNSSTDLLVLLGRLANALFYAFALYWIVRQAKIGKWVYVVVGLFPLMIHTAGSLSGDVMNNVIVFASLMYIFNLFVQRSLLTRRQVVTLAILAVLLAITKSTNIVFLLPLVALPGRLFQNNKRLKAKFNIRKWLLLAGCALVALLSVLALQQIFGSALFLSETVENPLKNDPFRFFYILYNTYLNPVIGYSDLLVRGIFGEFSSFKYHLPTVVVIFEVLLLLFAFLHKPSLDKKINQKELTPLAFASTTSFILLVLAVTFALYSAWAIQPHRLGLGAIYADGVQGRYFTAAIVALIPVSMFAREYISISVRNNKVVGPVIFASALIILIFYTAETLLVFS